MLSMQLGNGLPSAKSGEGRGRIIFATFLLENLARHRMCGENCRFAKHSGKGHCRNNQTQLGLIHGPSTDFERNEIHAGKRSKTRIKCGPKWLSPVIPRSKEKSRRVCIKILIFSDYRVCEMFTSVAQVWILFLMTFNQTMIDTAFQANSWLCNLIVQCRTYTAIVVKKIENTWNTRV